MNPNPEIVRLAETSRIALPFGGAEVATSVACPPTDVMVILWETVMKSLVYVPADTSTVSPSFVAATAEAIVAYS